MAENVSTFVTLRLRMDTADVDKVAVALEPVLASAQEAGFEVEGSERLGGEWHPGSSQRARQLGEDRQVGMEPHPLDPSHRSGSSAHSFLSLPNSRSPATAPTLDCSNLPGRVRPLKRESRPLEGGSRA
jgi:hypothetical protein